MSADGLTARACGMMAKRGNEMSAVCEWIETLGGQVVTYAIMLVVAVVSALVLYGMCKLNAEADQAAEDNEGVRRS